jgi:hypothetical protein
MITRLCSAQIRNGLFGTRNELTPPKIQKLCNFEQTFDLGIGRLLSNVRRSGRNYRGFPHGPTRVVSSFVSGAASLPLLRHIFLKCFNSPPSAETTISQ